MSTRPISQDEVEFYKGSKSGRTCQRCTSEDAHEYRYNGVVVKGKTVLCQDCAEQERIRKGRSILVRK